MIPRHKEFFSVLFCVILLTSGVGASALKEALEEHLKDADHKEGAESIKHEKQKGEKVHQIENQVNDSHKNQWSKANDEAKYLKKDHDTKQASESDAYEGYNANQDKVEDSKATGYKRGHKKGHHKQGFQNSYHKDESSNKSTFFDDLNDEGDQAAYNSRLASHDNHGGRKYKGGHNNDHQYIRDDYHGGGYQRYGDNGQKHIGHQDYGKNYHLDDHLHHNKFADDRNSYDRNKVHDRHEFRAPPPPPPPPPRHDPGWDWSKWEDSRRGWERPGLDRGWDRDPGWERDPGWDRRDPGWERRDPGWERKDPGWDYGGPGYYDNYGVRHDGGYGRGPYHGYGYGYDESRNDPVAQVPKNAPVVAHHKQTITIYEDPRYDGKDKGQLRREEGDYLQLEYKPSTHRYASYDSYYNVPATATAREGAMEASKINRLVYNYRKQ